MNEQNSLRREAEQTRTGLEAQRPTGIMQGVGSLTLHSKQQTTKEQEKQLPK